MTSAAANRPRLSESQVFGLRFFLLLAGASVAAWAVSLPDRLGAAQRWLATAADLLARLSGGDSTVNGDHINAGGLMIHVNFECTGVYVLLILVVFLIAYPASWRARAAGAALGFAALTAVNIFRIALLVRVAELAPDLFSYLHEYVWQGLFLVLVIAYAMTWVERVR